MTPYILKSRIFQVLGSSLVIGAALAACGGDVSTSGGEGTAGAGGTAGTAGAGGTAGGDAGPKRVCFTPDKVRAMCATTPNYCASNAGPWDADGGFTCPSIIGSGCTGYYGVVVRGEDCCYPDPTGVACGRPFLVAGEARRAPAVERADWLAHATSERMTIDLRTQRALSFAWLDDARLEHASIASFARFTLDLLALGAPADLVADAQRAATDEVDHARRCFSLATRYHGEALGPGALAIDGGLAVRSLVEAAVSAVREGCVGETMASLAAIAQLEGARDAKVRETLAVIAEDEARHAELAWRFVAWALDRGGLAVHSAVATAFREALDAIERAPQRSAVEVDLVAWRAHGRLSPSEERACQLGAARDVIEPCARALLARGGAAPASARAPVDGCRAEC